MIIYTVTYTDDFDTHQWTKAFHHLSKAKDSVIGFVIENYDDSSGEWISESTELDVDSWEFQPNYDDTHRINIRPVTLI